ncbi:MAG: adenylate/guanylate cyclase domain-containing protein [Anaerolineales bacterium]
MAPREYHYRWEWHLKASQEALWPLVSDTNRFNRDTGVPAVEVRPPDGSWADDNQRRLLRLYRFGVAVEWEEEPFEWVRPYRFSVIRRYRRGPVAEMRTLTELNPSPHQGTRLIYQVWARPNGLFGHIAIPAQIGVLSYRGFDRAFRSYDRAAASKTPAPPLASVRLAPGGSERLAGGRAALLRQGASAELADLLITLLNEADDMALFRLRPYALADYWEKPRRAVLELCLLATRAGVLNLRWELLCPLCRGNRVSAGALSEVKSQVHCDSCHIDYTVNFDRSVELTFRPNPAIRPTPESTYCVGGPQVTPHIVAQQLLPPGQQRTVPLELSPGRYRLRTLSLRGGQALAVDAGGAAQAKLAANDEGWPGDELLLAPAATVQLANETTAAQLFILERMAWSDQAATAAEVTSLQMFRDLFADEALRPGEHISVGRLTVMFTDLRGSTRLYRESGDAVAFGQVMTHFDILQAAITAESGAVVKTIGDAVMAVFLRPIAALRAVFRAQAALAAPATSLKPLQLKAGIHTGSCVAVTLNDRLDYFGSAVNIAARLAGLSAGQAGVVVSAAVRADPEVAAWLAEGNASAQGFEAALKGFEGERFDLFAVTPRTGAPAAIAAALSEKREAVR